MYSVRESFQKDPKGTLEQVAATGYHAIEFANHHADQEAGCGVGVPADKLRGYLDDFGLVPIGAHIAPFDDAILDRAIRYHTDLGTKGLVMSIDFWKSRAEVLDRCSYYNHAGATCRAADLQFYFHNHYHEFQLIDGQAIFDLIVKNTDPELVTIELDAYWTFRGAVDPARKIRQYGGRIGLVHQKDFPFSQARYIDMWARLDPDRPLDRAAFDSVLRDEEFVEIGDGMLKVQDIIDACNEAGVEYLLVEQDHGRELSEIERIARSMGNLRKMAGIEWTRT
jgi:sugar phosphate isomerase/epimerase